MVSGTPKDVWDSPRPVVRRDTELTVGALPQDSLSWV